MPVLAKLFPSIQARLLAVFLIVTLVTVVIVFGFNQRIQTELIAQADTALLVSAMHIADRIDEFNRSNRQVFNVGSRLPDLVEYLQADAAQRADPATRQRTLLTLDSLEVEPWDEYYVLSQAILDRSGVNILDTDAANIGDDESGHEYFHATLLGGTISMSRIHYRPDRGGIYFYYGVPLRDNEPPNSIIGVLRLQVTIASVQNIIYESAPGQGIDVALFDEYLVRVADTAHESLLFRAIVAFTPTQSAALRAEYLIPPLPDEGLSLPIPGLAELLTEVRQSAVATGYMTPAAEREDRLAIVRLETVPWTLVISRPIAAHLRTVQGQTTGILLLAVSLTFIALIASYLIAKRITEPIRALTAVAKQIAAGELHIKAAVSAHGEVGTLAAAFNQMTTEVESARALLEERVEQRTQELLVANEKLKHEIEERQRYEKQALDLAMEHERRRLLSEFIQNASHEFKTPLSIINVNSHLAKRVIPADNLRYIATIEDQSKYIDGLVTRMVLMSRLDSGIPTPAENVRVDDFVRSVYTRMADVFQHKHATARLDLQAAQTCIYVDADLLAIAVQNVLENALNYADEPAEITVTTRAYGETVTIKVEDNGIGIPGEMQARVFERFFRVDTARSTRGFGLGLTIAKRIVENAGGTITLISAVGKGTIVTIQLLAVTDKAPAQTPARPSDGANPER